MIKDHRVMIKVHGEMTEVSFGFIGFSRIKEGSSLTAEVQLNLTA